MHHKYAKEAATTNASVVIPVFDLVRKLTLSKAVFVKKGFGENRILKVSFDLKVILF